MSGCGGCKACSPKGITSIKDAEYTVALAGNANVGKSVTFNQLTGVDQIIGNWPGKTVERAEGLLQYRGHRIRIIDLPGIYSFSTYSMEELVSRDFIALERPDAVVNVIDASALERNLFFTIQLLELAPPILISVNQIDLAEKKGINYTLCWLGRLDVLPPPFDNILAVPVTFFLDRQGVIQEVATGCLDFETLKAKALAPDWSGPTNAAPPAPIR